MSVTNRDNLRKGSPGQVVDVLRDVLLEHLDDPNALDDYRVESIMYIGQLSGRVMNESDLAGSYDNPTGLRLKMRSGVEYDLWLKQPEKLTSDEGE